MTASEEDTKNMLESICSYLALSACSISRFADMIGDSDDAPGLQLWKGDIARYLRKFCAIGDLLAEPTPCFHVDAVKSVSKLADKLLDRVM